MKAIITGGTGLIGRALSADPAADGHEVIVLSRSPEKTEGLPAGVRAVPHHLLDLGFQFRFPELEGALRDALA
jgi:NAD dependent epimerase/dehydratase family enzyme